MGRHFSAIRYDSRYLNAISVRISSLIKWCNSSISKHTPSSWSLNDPFDHDFRVTLKKDVITAFWSSDGQLSMGTELKTNSKFWVLFLSWGHFPKLWRSFLGLSTSWSVLLLLIPSILLIFWKNRMVWCPVDVKYHLICVQCWTNPTVLVAS